MGFGRQELVTVIGSVACLSLFAIALKNAGISTFTAVNLQSLSFHALSSAAFTLLASVLLALAFLAAAFAFLASYGYHSDNRRVGMAGASGVVPLLLLFNFSVAALFLAAGIAVACVYALPLANTYGKEFRRWVNFRVGSNTAGKALFVVNLSIALGLYAAVAADLSLYQASFKQELAASMKAALTPEKLPGQAKAQVDAQIAALTESMPLLRDITTFLPLVTAVSAWLLLEFLRLFVSVVAGALSAVLIRMSSRPE